jgi:hypothetical protein
MNRAFLKALEHEEHSSNSPKSFELFKRVFEFGLIYFGPAYHLPRWDILKDPKILFGKYSKKINMSLDRE